MHTHHYRVYASMSDVWLEQYPQRTCEAMWSTLRKTILVSRQRSRLIDLPAFWRKTALESVIREYR